MDTWKSLRQKKDKKQILYSMVTRTTALEIYLTL